MVVFLIFCSALLILFVILKLCGFKFGLKYIIKLFEKGNVSVSGMKGAGKDVLFSNVVARRKLKYISNVDYKVKNEFIPVDLKVFDTKNSFENFINNTLKYYKYPYPDKIDIYISDAGIYFPSQYFSRLDKLFGYLPQFMATSRQLGDCAFHYNAQTLNRVWDKIREQSDTYILCKSCKVIFGIAFEKVYIYEKYQSCVDRVKPFKPMKNPIFGNSEARQLVRVHNEQQKNKYDNEYGNVESWTFVFRHKSKFDSRFIKAMLENGVKDNCEVVYEKINEKSKID